jgi:hypothetical protein
MINLSSSPNLKDDKRISLIEKEENLEKEKNKVKHYSISTKGSRKNNSYTMQRICHLYISKLEVDNKTNILQPDFKLYLEVYFKGNNKIKFIGHHERSLKVIIIF